MKSQEALIESCRETAKILEKLPANVFLENKQEDFITTLVTIKLTEKVKNNNHYFITQYSDEGIKRADIVEINRNKIVSHIECKYLYSFDFYKSQRAKTTYAKKEMESVLKKMSKTKIGNKYYKYFIFYCIHIENVEEILKAIESNKCSCLKYGRNIFTYIHNKRRVWLERGIGKKEKEIGEEIKRELGGHKGVWPNSVKYNCTSSFNVPISCCDDFSINFKIFFFVGEIE